MMPRRIPPSRVCAGAFWAGGSANDRRGACPASRACQWEPHCALVAANMAYPLASPSPSTTSISKIVDESQRVAGLMAAFEVLPCHASSLQKMQPAPRPAACGSARCCGRAPAGTLPKNHQPNTARTSSPKCSLPCASSFPWPGARGGPVLWLSSVICRCKQGSFHSRSKGSILRPDPGYYWRISAELAGDFSLFLPPASCAAQCVCGCTVAVPFSYSFPLSLVSDSW